MIKLTIHVQTRLRQRHIELAWIEATLADPEWQAADSDPTLTHSFKAITAFGGRILKVVHRAEDQDVIVVTA